MSFDSPRKNESTHKRATEDPNSFFTVGIVAARFNQKLVDGLLDNVVVTLEEELGKQRFMADIVRVPGSNELPYAVSRLAAIGKYDVIIALGVAIAGETNHHEIIAEGTANAFHQISVGFEVPVINGVVVTNTLAEAKSRTIGKINRGREFALAAMEMIDVADAIAAIELQEMLDNGDTSNSDEFTDGDFNDFN